MWAAHCNSQDQLWRSRGRFEYFLSYTRYNSGSTVGCRVKSKHTNTEKAYKYNSTRRSNYNNATKIIICGINGHVGERHDVADLPYAKKQKQLKM